ncbi:MAG: NUDIX hydrolase [Actinomycetota bacterium]|nr:NUDIX hydrolase [Actinomycetota bacterium]
MSEFTGTESVGTEQLTDEPSVVPVRSSEVLHNGKIWDVVLEEFEYGSCVLAREFVDHPGAVAVLAMDDEDRILLLRQYRHPIRMRDWELPAGLLDLEGEDPLEAAKRELAEEADLEADDWSDLAEFHTSPGGSNELLRVYLARGLRPTPAFARFAEEEHIELRWVALDEAVEAVLGGKLKNSILTIAVLTAHARRG